MVRFAQETHDLDNPAQIEILYLGGRCVFSVGIGWE